MTLLAQNILEKVQAVKIIYKQKLKPFVQIQKVLKTSKMVL